MSHTVFSTSQRRHTFPTPGGRRLGRLRARHRAVRHVLRLVLGSHAKCDVTHMVEARAFRIAGRVIHCQSVTECRVTLR